MELVNIRASSLSELFDCPARWEAKHILGMSMPRSGAAQLGTAIHASTAAYDQSRLPGGAPMRIDDAADLLVDSLLHPEEEVIWDPEVPRKKAEKIGLALHVRYCAEIAPLREYTGVEVKCDKLGFPDLGISISGTNDRVRKTVNGGRGISDLKSGGRAVNANGQANTQGHELQVAVYEVLAEYVLGVPITEPAEIVGLQTGKTLNSQRVGTAEIKDARALLIGNDERPGALEYASKIIRSGDFHGNNKSYLCSAKYCPAHPICRFKG